MCFECEITVFIELHLFYLFVMRLNLLNHTFRKYEFVYNILYGFKKNKYMDGLYFVRDSSCYYITINMSILVITVNNNNI